MTSPFVATDRLTKSFGNFTALDSVTLNVLPGEVFGLLGPNGAGKSTLIRTLLGFLNPTSGSATIDGWDCHRQRHQVHQVVSYLPGDARLNRMMRGHKLLELFCQFRAATDFDTALQLADRLELDLSRWVGTMSTGMRQKLALAIVLAADVPLLILDEPTANLDPTVRGQVLKLILEARQKGKAIVFSSHVLSEIEDSCDRVAILRSGKLVHQESIRSLNRMHRIRARTRQPLPAIPDDLQSKVAVKHDLDQVQIETDRDLSEIFRWLAGASLEDVHVQPIGLRSIYDQYHHPDTIPTITS
jgi:ABC-2 type transport system ATP-binding protein